MPKKYFVTRHRGAITWASQAGVKARKITMEHFDVSIVNAGDIVIGTLPVHLAAEVNARGGHYWHLSMEIPIESRGQELSADQMRQFNARLEEFRILGLGMRVSDDPDITPSEERGVADMHICIASGEALANYIPLASLLWKKVRIYTSKRMKDQAAHLKGMVELLAQVRQLPMEDVCEIISLPAKDDWQTLARFAANESAVLRQTAGSIDVNLTGGTKPMSMAFAEAFQSQARRLYCATDVGELQFLDAINTPALPLLPDLIDLESYLAAQAWSIRRSVVAESPDAQVWVERSALTASIVLSYQALEDSYAKPYQVELATDEQGTEIPNYSYNVLRLVHSLANQALPAGRGKKNAKPFQPWVRLYFPNAVPRNLLDLVNQFKANGLLADVATSKLAPQSPGGKSGQGLSFQWTSEDSCRYASGGYLEEYVWHCAQALQLPPNHVGANVAVSSFDFAAKGRSESEFNELDVAVVWNNRLLAIECKAGLQLITGEKDQDIINKLDSIKDNMGGAKGNAWLVTPAKVTEARVIERAKRNRITLVDGPDALKALSKTLATHLGLTGAAIWPGSEKVKLYKAPERK